MPFLDVTDVLLDPDFVDDSLVVQRMAQTVGSDGLAVNTPASTPFFGVVTSDSGDILNRTAEGSRIKGSITIHTPFRLIDGQAGNDADVVVWDGAQYTVSSVNNYSRFGRGFVTAICDVIPLSG